MADSTEPTAAECAALQADELTALASILHPDEFEQLGPARLQIRIPAQLGAPRKVRILSIASRAHAHAHDTTGTAAASGTLRCCGASPRSTSCALHRTHAVPSSHSAQAGASSVSSSSSPPAEASSCGRSAALRKGGTAAKELTLQHLPPLTLRVALPPRYPLAEPPHIEALEAPWLLPNVSADWLRARLKEQWEDAQAEVLWSWAEWVREGLWDEVSGGDAAPKEGQDNSWWPVGVDPPDPGDGAIPLFEATGPHGVHATPRLADILTAYDRSAETSAFEDSTFYCCICLEERKGRRCTRVLGCGHVFCSECLKDYCTVAMTDGQTTISCPDPDCTKAGSGVASGAAHGGEDGTTGSAADGRSQGSLLSDSELILLVGQEAFQRFAAMRKKTLAEADPSAAYCPVVGCGGVVLGRKEDVGTSFEALRECDQCGFAFCRWCAKSWHGKTPCELSAVSKLASAYLASAADSEERAALVRKYGASNLLRIVREYEEERANRAWLTSHTTRCPHCGCSVEKTHGCNHLTCARCGRHFCFICGQALNPAKPYAHFNTPGMPCYQRLFEGLLRDPVEGLPEQDGDGNEAADDTWVEGGAAAMQRFWADDGADFPWAALFAEG